MAVMPIEWGKVREYARATGADRPVYLDDPKAPIPPTFLSTVVYWTTIGRTLRAPEVAEACAEAGIEPGYGTLLSLEQEYVFPGPPPRAGESLYASERLRDVRVKQTRQGPMVMVRFVVSFHDDDGELRAECLYTSAYLRKEKS
ncbi:MaoC family dehydratase N-terminal domain-containing protein [Cryptosporangium sp. NPDC048952]|uniref:FAS1-like dehydratase domain-containing protein n=1 Tax=Cryptosporangium sp. NPDC048952 TaxID=3363961 RepID=UPI003715234D